MPRTNYKLFEQYIAEDEGRAGVDQNSYNNEGRTNDNGWPEVDESEEEEVEMDEGCDISIIEQSGVLSGGDSKMTLDDEQTEENESVSGTQRMLRYGLKIVSEMREMLKVVSTPALLVVASSCISRESNQEFQRHLVAHDDSVAEEAEKLWNFNRNRFTTHYLCNNCGKFLNARMSGCDQCGSTVVVSFVRIGAFWQILELVETFLPEILEIRRRLKSRESMNHNLRSPFFSERWQDEEDDHLNLSVVVSIDGVHVSGNTNKLWPVSLILVDLPAGIMQRTTSIVMEGLLECKETPSTAVWNSLLPMLFVDIENGYGKVEGVSFSCRIMTCTGDQPAKRAFYGMKSHHSSLSCFYCLSAGTYYKLHGDSRREVRPEDLTVCDSREGRNGFGSVTSGLVERILPYDTPIDLLHGMGEGLFDKIKRELMPLDTNVARKSELFSVDQARLKHFIDNVSFFRLVLCLAALECDVISPGARVVIVALSLLANKMYTDVHAEDLFDVQLCASACWFLSEASERYISMKGHEILFHLPEVNRIFRNTGPLSTHSFESYYQYALSGYSSSVTRYFSQNAVTKVLLHTSVRREIARRASKFPSAKLRKFISLTPDLIPQNTSWSGEITRLGPLDLALIQEPDTIFFGKIHLGIGNLTSKHSSIHTSDDMFFASWGNEHKCYRFVAALVRNELEGILAEPVEEVYLDEKFRSFQNLSEVVFGTDLYYTKETVNVLKSYEGMQCGRLSGRRVILPKESVVGVACCFPSTNYTIFVQANGALLHN
ncbi:hypothetical protein CRE_27834 [Caenorhabditis remanei]|uniref:Uncharacterized protein n=1 Tax=Caenorhabditis remanei TaxID=31234 RepID=E3NA80_CAERE|nr:hypothetical protein CRE_27834 [Caenorhabditis remanei]